MSSYQAHQREINDLLGELGWRYWTPLTIMGRLNEESGELAREVNHCYGEKKKKKDEPEGSIEVETGDIFYTLICFANDNGYNLDRAYWIGSWKRSAYLGRRPLSVLAELSRLIGLLMGEVNHWYGAEDVPQRLSILPVDIALGNLLLALDYFAQSEGFTLEGALRKSIDKVSVRDKDRFPDGI